MDKWLQDHLKATTTHMQKHPKMSETTMFRGKRYKASLLEAAPDLLEACKAIVREMQLDGCIQDDDHRQWLPVVEAAIAKAEANW